MTLRKPRPAAVIPPPLPKAVPYPPESLWRTWEEDEVVVYRGNSFKRKGTKVARVFEPAAP